MKWEKKSKRLLENIFLKIVARRVHLKFPATSQSSSVLLSACNYPRPYPVSMAIARLTPLTGRLRSAGSVRGQPRPAGLPVPRIADERGPRPPNSLPKPGISPLSYSLNAALFWLLPTLGVRTLFREIIVCPRKERLAAAVWDELSLGKEHRGSEIILGWLSQP